VNLALWKERACAKLFAKKETNLPAALAEGSSLSEIKVRPEFLLILLSQKSRLKYPKRKGTGGGGKKKEHLLKKGKTHAEEGEKIFCKK